MARHHKLPNQTVTDTAVQGMLPAKWRKLDDIPDGEVERIIAELGDLSPEVRSFVAQVFDYTRSRTHLKNSFYVRELPNWIPEGSSVGIRSGFDLCKTAMLKAGLIETMAPNELYTFTVMGKLMRRDWNKYFPPSPISDSALSARHKAS